MSSGTRGTRLLKRYPILKDVPDGERPAVVRAALRHPLLIIPFILVALLVLPLYFNEMFALFKVEEESEAMLMMAKYAVIVLIPIAITVPLLSRLIVPGFIKKEMAKRGYAAQEGKP